MDTTRLFDQLAEARKKFEAEVDIICRENTGTTKPLSQLSFTRNETLVGVRAELKRRKKQNGLAEMLASRGWTDPTATPTRKASYNGQHWTQRPENRARLLRMVRKNARARSAKAKPYVRAQAAEDVMAESVVKSTGPKLKGRPHHSGLHWTQKPENAAKLRKMVRKSAATRITKEQNTNNANI